MLKGRRRKKRLLIINPIYRKEKLMGYYKTLLTDQQEEQRLGNIDQDYEQQVTSELEQALADGDTERAMYLASVIDITIQ